MLMRQLLSIGGGSLPSTAYAQFVIVGNSGSFAVQGISPTSLIGVNLPSVTGNSCVWAGDRWVVWKSPEGNQIFVSLNGTSSGWYSATVNLPSGASFVFPQFQYDAATDTIFALGDTGSAIAIFKSTDKGVSWVQSGTALPGNRGLRGWALGTPDFGRAWVKKDEAIYFRAQEAGSWTSLYAGTSGVSTSQLFQTPGGSLLANDEPNNRTLRSPSPGNNLMTGVLAVRADGFAATATAVVARIATAFSNAFYRSINDGATWAITAPHGIAAITSPGDRSIVSFGASGFLAIEGASSHVLASFDNGQSFQRRAIGPFINQACIAARP